MVAGLRGRLLVELSLDQVLVGSGEVAAEEVGNRSIEIHNLLNYILQ